MLWVFHPMVMGLGGLLCRGCRAVRRKGRREGARDQAREARKTAAHIALGPYQYSLVTFTNSHRSGRIQPRKGDGRLRVLPHRFV